MTASADDRVVGAVLLLVVMSVLLVATVWGTAAALDDTGATDRIENEPVTQSGDWQALQADADRYQNETVTYDNQTLERNTDYEWRARTGEIRFLDSNDTTEGADANVSYDATDYPNNVAVFVGIFESLFSVGAMLPLVVAAGSVLYGVGWLQKTRNGGRW